MATVWLTKLLLSHLLTDFALQPYSWVRDRKEKHFASIKLYIHGFLTDRQFWIITALAVFLTTPAGILIGKLTNQWRQKIADAESLANAGKWIGVIERLIVFVLVLQSQYSAIGLLVTAKGIIRFNEKDRPEVKTEYLVIGTLLSIGIAIGAGLLTKI